MSKLMSFWSKLKRKKDNSRDNISTNYKQQVDSSFQEPDCQFLIESENENSLRKQSSDLKMSELLSVSVNNSMENSYKLDDDGPRSSGSPETSFMDEKDETKLNLAVKNKQKKNVYMISISNSKYFHIGSQKTININENPAANLNSQLSNERPTQINYDKFMDCQEKLNEEFITLISLHLNKHWKQFIKSLGLNDTHLEKLESRKINKIYIIYDVLQEYTTVYPNTSLGFIIYLLNEIQELEVIEKLVHKLKHE